MVDAMRGAVSAEFKAAMPAYPEKARTQWIFENSAQNTVVVSRAFFTAEVTEAFRELENGNEDALKVQLHIAFHVCILQYLLTSISSFLTLQGMDLCSVIKQSWHAAMLSALSACSLYIGLCLVSRRARMICRKCTPSRWPS